MNPSIDTLIRAEPFTVHVAYGPTSVLAEALYKGVRSIGPAVARKPQFPALAYVHLFTSEGCIYIEATDLEHPLREQVAARVSTDLNLCVPWRGFCDWLQIGARDNDLLELAWDVGTCILTVTAPHRTHTTAPNSRAWTLRNSRRSPRNN